MSTANPTDAHAGDLGPLQTAGLDRQASPASDFADFYRKNFPGIIKTLMLVCNLTSLPEAQDAAQEAFIIALRRWDRISGLEYPLAYIAKTAVRLARRHRKKAAREVPAESIAGRPAASPPAPDELAAMAAGGDMAAKMIARLPERQAITISLQMDGATPEEIGKIMDVRVSTVRSNLRFARASLKVLIREQMDDKPRA
jgi:RNA polymerase sigma-70 factor (ECF subfamily)